MFRKMRRFKQQTTEEKCIEILKQTQRGILSVHGEDGYPYGFPMDFVYEDNGKIYFHCARAGHKLDALQQNNKVSFCVYDNGYKKEGDWAWTITSVIVFGRIRIIEEDKEKLPHYKALGKKYFPDPDMIANDIQRNGKAALILELNIDHMTGKVVHEN